MKKKYRSYAIFLGTHNIQKSSIQSILALAIPFLIILKGTLDMPESLLTVVLTL